MEMQVFSYQDDSIQSMFVLFENGRYFCSENQDEIQDFANAWERYRGLVSTRYLKGDICELAKILELKEIKPSRSIYSVSREYGGSEEGGWYYNSYSHIEVISEDEEFENENPSWRNGYEGKVEITELYIGQNETKSRPYYS